MTSVSHRYGIVITSVPYRCRIIILYHESNIGITSISHRRHVGITRVSHQYPIDGLTTTSHRHAAGGGIQKHRTSCGSAASAMSCTSRAMCPTKPRARSHTTPSATSCATVGGMSRVTSQDVCLPTARGAATGGGKGWRQNPPPQLRSHVRHVHENNTEIDFPVGLNSYHLHCL